MTENLIPTLFSYFFISSVAIYSTHQIFKKKLMIDNVNKRSSHSVSATRSGGLGIFISMFFVSTFHYLLGFELYDYSILVPLSLLLIVGLYDDIYQLDFKLKFIFQIIAAKILIDNGLLVDNLHGVLGIYELNRVFAQFLTIFIIVAIVNSINFIDGIDGLAISIISLFIISFEFFANTNSPFLSISLITIFSIIPMYYFNFRKQDKVFLGDSGSLFLGGVVSIYVIYILTNNYIIKPEFDLHKIIYIISILFYPIFDMTRVFFLRIMKGKSPFEADKNHLHHILLKKTNSHVNVTLIIFFLSLLLILLTQIIL